MLLYNKYAILVAACFVKRTGPQVTIVWEESSMQSERRARIRAYIDTHNEASIATLLGLCEGCSSMTLWRDLKALEEEGAIRRTRGGAISMRAMQPDKEGLYSYRAQQNAAQKRRIGAAAARYVKPGSAVFLDSGSTIMSMCEHLQDLHYTIITSGANIAIELARYRSCTILGLGGQISANTLSYSGPQAIAALDTVNIDTAIMATSGFSVGSGFTSGSFSEAQVKNKAISKANRVIMLMDMSKIGHPLPFTFAALEDIDVLVTDAPLQEDMRQAARDARVEVLVAAEG